MKFIRFFLLILFISTLLVAQKKSINYSGAFKKAVEVGTRTYSGKPGKNYWINKAYYKIKASLDVETGVLKGSAKIVYKTYYPKEFRQIYIKLHQNMYKKGAPRDFSIYPVDAKNGIVITKLIATGEKFDVKSLWINNSILIVTLKKSVGYGETVNIEIDWNFSIPSKTSIRMGTYDKSSFFVGYWYPQIAVLDDIHGWDRSSYKGITEFYNDFNNFDVEITLPKNFIVWGTGVLQNPRKVLSDKYYRRYQKAKHSDEIISIIDSTDLILNNFTPDKENLVWKFSAENVPDFAFATSDHYLWDLTSIQFDPKEKRTLVGAAYKKESADFYEVTEIAKKTILYLSNEMPGIKYPWPCMTIFNGKGGMEFPMIVNDGSSTSFDRTLEVTAHEITHTYFPFYTGINETKYAFMDEGWAVMLILELQRREGKEDPLKKIVQTYNYFAGTDYDLPLRVPSDAVTFRPYYQMVYTKAALANWFLMDAIGKPTFKKALQKYIARWKGKHPVPYDFYHTIEDVTGENLDWFWRPWFFEFGAPDLEVEKVSNIRNTYIIKINKLGKIPVPVKVELFFDDGTSATHYESCKIWKNKSSLEVKINSEKKAIKVTVGGATIPDIDKKNNKLEI